MTQQDAYLLGRAAGEEARLKRQIADLAPDSDAQFEKIGIKAGERVIDLGCGPGGVLHLLKNAFDGALTPMVECLLDSQPMDEVELKELERLIKEKKAKSRK